VIAGVIDKVLIEQAKAYGTRTFSNELAQFTNHLNRIEVSH